MTTQNKEKTPPKTDIKFSITLSEEQKRAKERVLNCPVNFLVGPAGSGKAQPLDCKVYTPTGPVLMGNIKTGDKVCTPGGVANVTGIYPKVRKMYMRLYVLINRLLDAV